MLAQTVMRSDDEALFWLVTHKVGGLKKGRLQLLAHSLLNAYILHCLDHAAHPLIARGTIDFKGHVALA